MTNTLGKYRGKQVENGEWVYGFLYGNRNTPEWAYKYYIRNDDACDYEVTEESIGQWTGHNEDRGEPVWQGDLYLCIYAYDGCKHISEIIWDNDAAGFRLKYHGQCQQKQIRQTVEDVHWGGGIKLGNIHDNPDLLSAGESN